MTRCLDESKLQGYFDGELSLEQMESVTSHLASCITCAAAARELDLSTSFITMLRHPAEILKSARRSYGDWQTDASRAASWLNVMLESERATGMRRTWSISSFSRAMPTTG